jgi:hypothetical protein
MITKFFAKVAVIIMMLLCVFPVLAQEPPLPVPGTPSAPREFSEWVDISINDFRIAFLVSSEISDEELPVSVIDLEELTEAEPGTIVEINDWQTLIEINEEEPFDALIIDRSALSFVDSEWIFEAYKSRVVIAVINIYFPELAYFTSPNCDEEMPSAEDWYPEGHDYFIIKNVQYYTTEDSDRQIILNALENCESVEDVHFSGEVRHGSRGSAESLEEADSLLLFTGVLLGHLRAKYTTDHMVIEVTAQPSEVPN